MNSIKNAIVTVTLLVVGYGSYVVLKEPNPTPFVDPASNDVTAIRPTNSEAYPGDLQQLGANSSAVTGTQSPAARTPTSQLQAPKLRPTQVSEPVGTRPDTQPQFGSTADFGNVAQQKSAAPELQPPTLNSPNVPSELPTPQLSNTPLQIKQTPIPTGDESRNSSPFGSAMSNLSNAIGAAKDSASQQLTNAKSSIASRFEQAQEVTQNAIQAATEFQNEVSTAQPIEPASTQASPPFEPGLSQTPTEPMQSFASQETGSRYDSGSRYQAAAQSATSQPAAQEIPMPTLSEAIGEPNAPRLTTNVSPAFGQQNGQPNETSSAVTTADQAGQETAPSRFGKLQANEVAPQKTRIEPPVAALAEPNSDIRPPFANELQNDNPFRKTITINETQDERPLVPRVEEWDPYVGPPLSASELAARNGDPAGTNPNENSISEDSSESNRNELQFGPNPSQAGNSASNNLAPANPEVTSIKVVEPGLVLPADATPAVSNEQFHSQANAATPPTGNRFQEGATATFAPSSTTPSGASHLEQQAASPNFASSSSQPTGAASSSAFPAPAANDTGSTEAATETVDVQMANSQSPFASVLPNPVRPQAPGSFQAPGTVQAPDSIQAPIGNILPPAAADNATAPQLSGSVSNPATGYPTTNSPSYVNPSVSPPPATQPVASQPQIASQLPAAPQQSAAPQQPTQPNPTFERVWGEVQIMLKNRDYARALRSLTPWSSESNLNSEQNIRCIQLLDKLAGAIVYSRTSYLEPAYVVRAGETLDEIAALHNVPQELLAKINGIAQPYALTTGEKLKVVRGPFRASVSLSRQELTLFAGPNYAGRFKVKTGRDLPPDSAFYEVAEKSNGRTYFDKWLGREVNQSESINRYGQHWLGLRGEHITAGHSVGIHARPSDGTSANDVGSISLSAKDAADVFSILSVGSRVEVRP